MGVWRRRLLPRLIDCSCGQAAVARQRAFVVPHATGAVLELGFGSGRNLPYYDPARVGRVVAVDPDEGMLELGRAAAASAPVPVTFMATTAEQADLPEASFDTLLVTFSLCTIPDAASALRAAGRALKPEGTLLFCEHGLAADASVRRVQRGVEPLWRRLSGGCRLTKHIPSLIREAGFALEELSQGYAPGAPRFAGYVYRGRARRV